VTPHESRNLPDEHGMGRWLLMALQVLAMALCACLIARFIMEDAFKLPREMCIERPAVVQPDI
jgi:hypothetical protein